MYEAHFGLNRRPFPPAPDPQYYFPSEAIEAARQNLLRCLDRAEGTGLIIGASGTGKTLLCQVLAEQLRERLAVVHLCSGRLSSRTALYQAILHGLDQSYRAMDEGELRLALVDYLTAGEEHPNGLVLLVDEAYSLPLKLLDEIRMLTNLVNAGEPRVRVLLAGSPLLEERFTDPKLESFSQRLVVRCYLEPFKRAETRQYIQAQIEAAGGNPEQVFDAEATMAVYQATEGVPRLVNQLCDHALLLTYADGETTLDAGRIENAWADLQQLPTPWTGKTNDSANVIEFGGLDEDESCHDEAFSAETICEEPMISSEESDLQIEAIERTLSELQHEASQSDDSIHVSGTIGPEVEITFDEQQSPLHESFMEEEEVVQPRFTASPEQQNVVAEQAETDQHSNLTESTVTTIETEQPIREAQPESISLRLRRHETEDEKDLIVVEDQEKIPSIKPVKSTAGRGKQYRNLFAQLRQG